MGNFDTVKAITDNTETVLKAQGINFTRKTFDDLKQIPAALIPLGNIFYQAETPENIYGERPTYIEAEFMIKVVLSERDPQDMITAQQKWAHLIRNALTVNALNIGALASSMLVSRIIIQKITVDNHSAVGIASLFLTAVIRYRET